MKRSGLVRKNGPKQDANLEEGNDQPSALPHPMQPLTRGVPRDIMALVEATKASGQIEQNQQRQQQVDEARRFEALLWQTNRCRLNQRDAQARWSKAHDAADASHTRAPSPAPSPKAKPVPAEVLADYPDLAPKPAQAPLNLPRHAGYGAADYAPIFPRAGCHRRTRQHQPCSEKQGQQRRDEYAATLNAAREQLDAAAKTDEQSGSPMRSCPLPRRG